MKHAVLGIGGVGGLVAGLLAKSGHQVDAIVRPQVLAAQPDHILIHQPTGRILANVRITSVLDRSVDVFWIAVKATQLETALEGISGNEASVGAVVPLLNGIDHVGRLREFFGRRVVPATISVESERVAPRTYYSAIALCALRDIRPRPITTPKRDGEIVRLWDRVSLYC
jgi:2-dehydropantoate 2-reductase